MKTLDLIYVSPLAVETTTHMRKSICRLMTKPEVLHHPLHLYDSTLVRNHQQFILTVRCPRS